MLNIIDLFSGAGGLSEGFRNENMNFVAHVEMDESACKTLVLRECYYYLKSNNNSSLYDKYITKSISFEDLLDSIPEHVISKVLNYEISDHTLNELFSIIDRNKNKKNIDGIIGGPPCQAYSTIGRARNKHLKNNDNRIYLYKHYIKFLERYQPDFFLFENVKGLRSFKDIDDSYLLPKILKEFSDVTHENFYNIREMVIDSSEYGVCQKRERLFIFGYKNSLNEFDFFERLIREKEIPATINQLFRDLPVLSAGETINSYSQNSPHDYTKKYIRSKSTHLTQNISRKNNKIDLEIYNIVASKKLQDINVKYSDLPSHLIKHKNSTGFLDRFKALDGNNFSHTVVAHIAKDGHYYIHPDVNQNRSITVREAARIQSFPDNYYFEDSRTAAFKQIGNAFTPVISRKFCSIILKYMYNLKFH